MVDVQEAMAEVGGMTQEDGGSKDVKGRDALHVFSFAKFSDSCEQGLADAISDLVLPPCW